jgi:exodeoxyribonuclease-5
VQLTKDQNDVIRQILKHLNREQVQTFAGYAGTGKTTCVKVLAEKLPTFACCAFTGKAAHVMRQKGMKEASTIHSRIYKLVRGPNRKFEFVLRQRYELGCEGFLVDEASMVGGKLHDDLLSFGLPIVFVGDSAQLPPVCATDIFLMQEPMYRLVEIHRHAGEIAHFAQHIRKGKLPHRFQGNGAVQFLAPNEVDDDLLLTGGQVLDSST